MIYTTNDILLLQQLSTLGIVSVDKPVFSYDALKKQIVYTFVGRTAICEEYIIEIRIKRFDNYRLEAINVYSPQINLPPPLILTNFGGVATAGSTFTGTIITAPQYVPPQTCTVQTSSTQLQSTTLQFIQGGVTFNLLSPTSITPPNNRNITFIC